MSERQLKWRHHNKQQVIEDLIGFLARPAAFIAAGEMAVASWMVHAPGISFPAINQGDDAILFCLVFLYLVFAGPGAWSVNKK